MIVNKSACVTAVKNVLFSGSAAVVTALKTSIQSRATTKDIACVTGVNKIAESIEQCFFLAEVSTCE